MSIISVLPIVLNQLIITYLRYADYDDEEIRKVFHISIITFWRKSSNVKDGMANGVKHSVDDQQIINGDFREWYRNGKRHRSNDLPAIISDDHQAWYIDGKQDRIGDLPVFINRDVQIWRKNGVIHRDGDLPARININSNINSKEWFKNGKHHRDNNLPAIISICGGVHRDYFIEGVHIRTLFP